MKKRSPHLFVDISFHGFGHIGQTMPILNLLLQRMPDLRLTIRSSAPRPLMADLLAGEFEHIHAATDFGMIMGNAVTVLSQESARQYVDFHSDWDARVAREAEILREMAPDLVLSNVSYLALAAARHAGIPAVGMCSLNWADLFIHYCADIPDAQRIHMQMLSAYNSADVFLRLMPGMPMHDFHNLTEIAAIARSGLDRRAEINARMALPASQKLVLITMGGMHLQIPVNSWPRIPGISWIVKRAWGVTHPDAIEQESLDMHYTDIMRSCDALLTKPGYANFAEAAVNGIPVLYLSRNDWPEEPYLVEWFKLHGRCLEVQHTQVDSGDLAAALQALWGQVAKPPVVPEGVAQATDIIEGYMKEIFRPVVA